jgi:hypothetical protein
MTWLTYTSRRVRTIRQEYLDHLLVVSRRHLEQVLAEFVRHYNDARQGTIRVIHPILPNTALSLSLRGVMLSRPVRQPGGARTSH